MDIEKAIKILKDMRMKMDIYDGIAPKKERKEEIQFAIEVLSNEYDSYKKGMIDGFNNVIKIIKEDIDD